MRGAIIGDIVGSIYEFNNHRSKDFPLFGEGCFATDDSIMSLCVGKAIADTYDRVVDGWDYDRLSAVARIYMQAIGQNYPACGYGGRFFGWIMNHDRDPYNSYGNGAAMRVSACGEAARSVEEAEKLAEAVTRVSHNHPEGIKGAQATAVAVHLALRGEMNQTEIANYIQEHYYPDYKFLEEGFMCDDIRPKYRFNETCQETVPQALECFFESKDYEDCIRNCVSIGGDSDTIGAIAGAVAEAFHGMPIELVKKADEYLDDILDQILLDYEKFFISELE